MNKQEYDNQTIEDLPVADEQTDETKGGQGSRDAHFRESTLGNELIDPLKWSDSL